MSSELSNSIKAEAIGLGFTACGIAKAEPVDNFTAQKVMRWLAQGDYAGMAYMNNYTDKRLDPRLLMPEVKSIVCVALNYAPARTLPEGEYQFAAYALGKDYHDIVKAKLHRLAAIFGFENYRAFCDSAPVLERYWAERAGLGWTGRNHQLIIPKAGSMFFLGELFLDVELEYDRPQVSKCGRCHACIDACPTQAILPDREFDAEKCLSYQTIENREDLNPTTIQAMGNTIYGCDRCQQACPWNRFATPNTTPELQPNEALLGMTKERWHNLSEEEYRQIFKGSAVKRAKYAGLMRNIQAANKHQEETGNEYTDEQQHS